MSRGPLGPLSILALLIALLGWAAPTAGARPTAANRIFFESAGTIYSVAPSGRDLRTVTSGLSPSPSADGRKVAFLRRVSDFTSAVYISDSSGGGAHAITKPIRDLVSVDLSPNGRRVALTAGNPSGRVYVVDATGSHLHAITRGLPNPGTVDWSPDGANLAFATERYFYRVPARGGRPRRMAEGYDPAWSPNGRQIAFSVALQVFTISAAGGRSHTVLSQDTEVSHPTWSPDGRSLAFVDYGAIDDDENPDSSCDDRIVVMRLPRGPRRAVPGVGGRAADGSCPGVSTPTWG